jgi:hypothetical protein
LLSTEAKMEKSTEGFPGGKLRRKTAIARLAVGVAVIAITLQGLGEKNSETLGPGDHYAQVGDVRLHYKVAGSGPLLIVCSSRMGNQRAVSGNRPEAASREIQSPVS